MIELTLHHSGKKVWVNAYKVMSVHEGEGATVVRTEVGGFNGAKFIVRESTGIVVGLVNEVVKR
jgi:uncharacterized protein YlzI (FlbEa/FlbD family)